MRRHRLTLLIALVACGGEVDLAKDVPTLAVEPTRFVIRIAADGEIKARSAVSVSGRARRSLTIAWLADEGSRVGEGDVVVEFDATEAEDELKTAEAEVAKIDQEVRKHGLQVTARRDDLHSEGNRARIAHEKAAFKADLDDGLLPRIEIEEAKMDLRLAEIDEARVERAKTARDPQDRAELALLEIKLDKAQTKRDRARETLAWTQLKAPSRGVVRHGMTWKAGGLGKYEAGDSVWAGRPVVDLLDLSSVEFVARVREQDAVRVAEEQLAVIRLSALPGHDIAARVRKVAAVAQQTDPTQDVKWVEVRLELIDPPDGLWPGLTGQVSIEVITEDGVIALPPDAVIEEDDATFVYVRGDGGPVRRTIEVGAQGDAAVVITAGLTGAERVYARDPTKTPEELTEQRRDRQEQARKKRKKTGSGGRSFVIFN